MEKGLAKTFFKKNCPDQVVFFFQSFVPKTLNSLYHFLEIFLSDFLKLVLYGLRVKL